VDDPVAVALKLVAELVLRLGLEATATGLIGDGVRLH
jgi:hypothetical protein